MSWSTGVSIVCMGNSTNLMVAMHEYYSYICNLFGAESICDKLISIQRFSWAIMLQTHIYTDAYFVIQSWANTKH